MRSILGHSIHGPECLGRYRRLSHVPSPGHHPYPPRLRTPTTHGRHPRAAPSNELRHWFGHDEARWDEFREKYIAELSTNLSSLQPLLDMARQGPLTLLYAAHDEAHNNAIVLAAYLTDLLSPKKPH